MGVKKKAYFKLWLLIIIPIFILGNVRPPDSKLFMSSMAIRKSKDALFRILREDLSITCSDIYRSEEPLSKIYLSEEDIIEKYPIKRCFIEATYYFVSDNDARSSFFFVLPKKVDINILVNGKVVKVKKIEREPKSVDDREGNYDIDILRERILELESKGTNKGKNYDIKERDIYMKMLKERVLFYRYMDTDYSLYNVEFESDIKKGENVIYISYQQPLSFQELGHGSCSKGIYVNYISYEVWPIKEWERNDDFFIDLRVKLSKEFKKYVIESSNKDSMNVNRYEIKPEIRNDFILLNKKIYNNEIPDEIMVKIIKD